MNFILAIAAGFTEVVVDHAAAILPGFGYSSVTAFLVSADLILRVKTLQYEFACGNQLSLVRGSEFERNRSRVRQLGYCLQKVHALCRRSSIGKTQIVSLIEPPYDGSKVDSN